MAEEIGDDDEIGSAAREGGGEGVPEDMGSGVVVKAGVGGNAGNDVVGAPDAQAATALIEETAGVSVDPGQSERLSSPALSTLRSWG